jgi:hypothetical protein
MIKENQPPKVKKYHKILITVLMLMFVVVGVIAWWQMSKYYEGYQMSSLDNHMRTLYQDIQLQAEPDEDWVYETGCIEQKSGDFQLGYFCVNQLFQCQKKSFLLMKFRAYTKNITVSYLEILSYKL